MKPALPSPILCLITDRKRFGGERLAEVVARAVEGGVNLVQLREKDLPEDALYSLACELREVTRGRALLVINGSPEIARSAGADGVHLPESHLENFKTPLPGILTGQSVHSVESARRAAEGVVDFLQVGHIFATPSHPGEPPRGTALLSEIREAVSLPLIAVGGIDASNAGECILAGARGVAVISATGAAPRPSDAARELWRALEREMVKRGK